MTARAFSKALADTCMPEFGRGPHPCGPEEFLANDAVELSQQWKCSVRTVDDAKLQLASAVLGLTMTSDDGEVPAPRRSPWSLLPDALPDVHAAGAPRQLPMPYSSGLPTLNEMLGGGWPQGLVIGLTGEGQCGKTQICLHTAVATAMAGQRVLYIDTSNHLPLRRMHTLASYLFLNQQLDNPSLTNEQKNEVLAATLDRITVEKVFDLFDLLDLLCKVKDRPTYHVVIVDSLFHIISPYLSDAAERFVPSYQNPTASLPTGVGSAAAPASIFAVANVQPLVSQILVLLKAIASSTVHDGSLDAPRASVLVTNVSPHISSIPTAHITGVKRPSGAAQSVSMQSTGATGGASSSHGSAGSTHSVGGGMPAAIAAGMTGGSAVYLDTLDCLLQLSCPRPVHQQGASEETLLRAGK